MSEKPVAILTGVSGALAYKAALELAHDHTIVGVDTRPLKPGHPFPGSFFQVKHYAHRQVAEVFRQRPPELLVHIGTVPSTVRNANQRFTQNVLGTRNLLRLCAKHGARRVVIQSTYHVYGAYEANHVNIHEDEPLRASQTFPQIADVVEMDHAATTFMWQHREIETVVLRMTNMIGPSLRNLISRVLRGKRVPRLLGYDPVMQFLHEDDAVRALAMAARQGGFGVYNVGGEGAVAWSWAIRHAGARYVSVPHLLAYPIAGALFRTRSVPIPEHLMDYFRYPVIIDDQRFRDDFGYTEQHTTVETLRSVRGLS